MADRTGFTMDLLTWWARRLPLPRRVEEKPEPGVTHSYVPGLHQTVDKDLPWVIFTYGRIHDGWWPFWRSSRVLGRAAIGIQCAVCGRSDVVVGKMPRFGPVNPERREHPERIRFKLDHLHKDRPHPMAWAKPLLNPDAHKDGLDLELLAMRLQADIEAAS